MADLSETDKSFLEELAEFNAEHDAFTSYGMMNFTLVTLGERPAGEILVADSLFQTPTEAVKELLLNLFNKKTKEQKRSEKHCREITKILQDTPLTVNENTPNILFAKDATVLESLPTSSRDDFTSEDHIQLGRVLGYAESAIEIFGELQSSDVNEFVVSNTPWSRNEFVDATYLTNYIPAPTMQSIQQTIETNQQRYEALSSLQIDDNEYPHLSESLEVTLSRYEGLTDPTPEEFFTSE